MLRLHPRLAPYKAGIFPLVKKDGLPEIAERLEVELNRNWNVFYDESGAIGRRYRRQDEVGTPFGLTVDYDTLKDQTITVRERDSMRQSRIALDAVARFIRDQLEA